MYNEEILKKKMTLQAQRNLWHNIFKAFCAFQSFRSTELHRNFLKRCAKLVISLKGFVLDVRLWYKTVIVRRRADYMKDVLIKDGCEGRREVKGKLGELYK